MQRTAGARCAVCLPAVRVWRNLQEIATCDCVRQAGTIRTVLSAVDWPSPLTLSKSMEASRLLHRRMAAQSHSEHETVNMRILPTQSATTCCQLASDPLVPPAQSSRGGHGGPCLQGLRGHVGPLPSRGLRAPGDVRIPRRAPGRLHLPASTQRLCILEGHAPSPAPHPRPASSRAAITPVSLWACCVHVPCSTSARAGVAPQWTCRMLQLQVLQLTLEQPALHGLRFRTSDLAPAAARHAGLC